MKRKASAYILIFTIALLATACSTTRVLGDGEYSLAGTKVNVTNRTKDFKEAGLAAYIKQKPNSNFIFGWNPFVSVYNWSNGKGKGWDKFVQKLGVAPIIYDPELVDESVENLEKHLEYIGYYGSKHCLPPSRKGRTCRRLPCRRVQLHGEGRGLAIGGGS